MDGWPTRREMDQIYYVRLHPTKPGCWIIDSPLLQREPHLARLYKGWGNALDAISWLRERMNVPWRQIVWVWTKKETTSEDANHRSSTA